MAAAPPNWFSPSEQPLDSGEIDSHHALLVVLNQIFSRRLTGKLQIVFGRVEKALFFDGGQLVFATSSDRQDGLGEVMLRAGALTQSQFEEASTLVETGQRFGSAIAEMGAYAVEEIVTWVHRQVIQVIASVLDYPAGRYYFFSSLEKNVVPEIGMPVPQGKLLLEAVRKANDLPLDRLAQEATFRVELSSELQRLFKTEELEDRERYVLGLISQRMSAKEIVSISGLTRPQASRALYALLLLGFVVGVPDAVGPDSAKAESEPAVPVPPAELEKSKAGEASVVLSHAQPQPEKPPAQAQEVKAVDGPHIAEIPEQRPADFPVPAEEAKASETPSAGIAADPQPHLEEIPREAEEPKETEAPPTTPVPLLKPNMISRDVPVRVTGIAPERNELGRQLFNEETISVLVAETCGVIRLSAAVTPGQLLVLANVETKREAIVQVLRKRAYKPTFCYLELEFVEPAPRFWGTEFSAAAALLPKNAQDAETIAMVVTAEPSADQPGILPPMPDAGELQTFQREIEELRRKSILTETPAASTQAIAPAHLSAEVSEGRGIPGPRDSLSTEAILNSGMDAAAADLPIKHEPPRAPWESTEQAEAPQPVWDFIQSLPRSKRWRMPRGSFTPGFRKGVVRLALLIVALVVTIVGAAWFKNWLPWKPGGAKKPVGIYNMKVASDVPLTSPGIPAKSAPRPNTDAPGQAAGVDAPRAAASSRPPIEKPGLKKNTSSVTTVRKPSRVRPAGEPASIPAAIAGNESDVVPPKLIHSVQAVASLNAVRDFETGNVIIDAVVGTSGEVHFISVISGPPSLRAPAVESLKEYKYKPATRNGQPVPAHVTITIHFRFEP
ncbi:MAG: energy transducer TonB [Candidatus Acidiferrum sp.]